MFDQTGFSTATDAKVNNERVKIFLMIIGLVFREMFDWLQRKIGEWISRQILRISVRENTKLHGNRFTEG